MARWKLMTAHYLSVPGEEWEYTENDRTTGRPKRMKFAVPRYLDIRDPSSWTHRWGNKDNEDGEIIVCWEGRGEAKDITFIGDPTPDMEPVDDEAREISEKFKVRWQMAPETGAGDYSQSLIDRFQVDMAELRARPPEIPGLSDLTAAIGKMVEQNAELLKASSGRRV